MADPIDVLLTRLDPDVPVPAYAHPGDAGADLVTTVDVRLEPGERALVPTGVAIALPRDAVELRRGDRIAQLVLQRVEQARFVEVDALPGSARGAGGYGSTGGFRGPDEEKQ